ncbi:MAG: TRAP transporter small permease subunit [Planctomycetota bacterium]|jgi:TRAP-type C4-dicarboxylate transport system permease small subunit|nr:TRAP transporter small permease subunit [Planctomycetota bacterium]
MKTVFFWHSRLQGLINWIIGLALMLLLTVILLQTFFRYVVFYSLPWSEELSRYLFVVMILLGVNIGITRDNFVRIDLIDNFLPGFLKPAMEISRELIALAVSCFFVYSTIPLMRIGRFQRSPAMQITMDVMYGILCLGFSLAVLSLVLRLLARFAAGRPRERETQ